jgi:hypothetical protein
MYGEETSLVSTSDPKESPLRIARAPGGSVLHHQGSVPAPHDAHDSDERKMWSSEASIRALLSTSMKSSPCR